jgi:eukaryotic-like serine/threonine-protein kinase
MTGPRLSPRRSTAAEEIHSVGSLGLPADILAESMRRLQAAALLYAGGFFLAAIFPNLLCRVIVRFTPNAVCPADYFTDPRFIGPPATSILVGIGVFALVRWANLPAATKLNIGLAFEVLGSIGIAVAEYRGIIQGIRYVGMENLPDAAGFGLSWVSVWVMLFTVVVPSPPRRAIVAAALSVAAVPVTFALYVATGITTVRLGPPEFFFALVLPYAIVLTMAGVAASVVYRLGSEVRRARELGSYRLVERLGEGGMGEVWRAEHRLLARPAAVKLIRQDALGPAGPERRRVNLQRFEREAQATASMRCPHTVELYDFGVADDGTFYYVMELLDGLDLEALVRDYGPVEAGRAIHLLTQLCHSLGEAHEIGLIHRDIKPANIYTCRLGRETDWVKVLDFGMVKRHGEIGDSDPKLTADNVVGGTPAYMAPEQALGDPIDGRADLYAAGCVAYWLLTGQQVFKGRTPMETMMQHAHATPVPPSQRSELPIPVELDAVIMACLAKAPGERPQTADALALRLQDVPIEHPWTAERAARWWDTYRPRADGRTGG